jgi:hypothetical protein
LFIQSEQDSFVAIIRFDVEVRKSVHSIGGGQSRFSEVASYRRIADSLRTKRGYKIVMDRDCRQSLPGEIQDD